jgi:hypothetical protein
LKIYFYDGAEKVRRKLMAPYDSSFSSPVAGWRRDYESALLETDHKALFKRVEVADAAILSRREELQRGADGFAERREIEKALTRLRKLKKEILNFP